MGGADGFTFDPKDEAGNLRRRLRGGEWLRLVDPLLPLLLLTEVGRPWWLDAQSNCAREMCWCLPQGDSRRDDRWKRAMGRTHCPDWARDETQYRPWNHPRRTSVKLAQVRDRLRQSPDSPSASQVRAALAVLTQFRGR